MSLFGTTDHFTIPVTDYLKRPVVPTDFVTYAVKRTPSGDAPALAVASEEVDGNIVGEFHAPEPGIWDIYVQVNEPVQVRESESMRFDASPNPPGT